MPEPRIIFMGTGDIAIPSFESLQGNGLIALVTQPDKPVGRKQIMTPPRIKQLAEAHNIPALQPEKASSAEFLQQIKDMRPDIMVVMAYGQILTQKLLDIPNIAFINLHASLLPKFRGASCIQAAIDTGETHTGITAMHVVKKLDAGDIILKKELTIDQQETASELYDRLAKLAPDVMNHAVDQLMDGSATRTSQDETLVSYVPKLMREDGEIDWTQPATHIERRIRAFHPWPGTFTCYTETKGKQKGRSKRLKIFPHTTVLDQSGAPGEVLKADTELVIACGKQALQLTCIQPDGSRKMDVQEFLRGQPLKQGDIIGGTH